MRRKDAAPPPLSDREIRDRMMADPEVRARLAQALLDAERPSSEPGVTEEELPAFLREHG